VGRKLCKKHFIEFFEKRVRKTINEHKYFHDAKKIAIGLSGGKDSATLIHLLKKLSRNKELVAITIESGIKGYDEKLLINSKKICEKLGIEQHIFSIKNEFGHETDDIARIRPGMCNCGIFKRHLLNKKARELGADKIATGHNLDDEVEAILLNVFRGDVKRIARGNSYFDHEKFVERIKPLQRCPEDEIAIYAGLLFPDFDFSAECPYRSVFLRYNVKEMIDELEKKHPGIKFQIYEGNEKIKRALIKNGQMISKIILCERCGEICSGKICQACEFKENIDKILHEKK